jgi:hypothetical protein
MMRIFPTTEIPRGNTQKDVNRLVVSKLIEYYEAFQTSGTPKHLDAPCGDGTMARTLNQIFPDLFVEGVDAAVSPKKESQLELHQSLIHSFLADKEPREFESITCVSGVMCFDGLPELFQLFARHLKSGGLLVVTNDNILTIRDRVSFLFFGQLKRFRLAFDKQEGNWNVVLPQALHMFFRRNRFENIQIQYTSIYLEDWIFLPMALIIYPLMVLKLSRLKTDLTLKDLLSIFPFQSLLARHYILTGRKS